MKPHVLLVATSLLSILLLSIHIAEDIVLGFAPGGLTNLIAIGILVVYLCGTLLRTRSPVGLDHSPRRIAHRPRDAGAPHDGSGRWRQPIGRSLLLRLDALRTWGDWDVWPRPFGAGALEREGCSVGYRSVSHCLVPTSLLRRERN